MTEETQQKILKAVNQMQADLSAWLDNLGQSEADAAARYEAIIRENGLASQLLLGAALKHIPYSDGVQIQPELRQHALRWIRSEQFPNWLLSEPEPTDEELNKLLAICKNSLPNLRKSFLRHGKLGPRCRGGGRPKELPDPDERRKIRETIKSLREPGVKLADLFQRMAAKYGVSVTTIKRIWGEKTPNRRTE